MRDPPFPVVHPFCPSFGVNKLIFLIRKEKGVRYRYRDGLNGKDSTRETVICHTLSTVYLFLDRACLLSKLSVSHPRLLPPALCTRKKMCSSCDYELFSLVLNLN
jgi:hypothetical protein